MLKIKCWCVLWGVVPKEMPLLILLLEIAADQYDDAALPIHFLDSV